MSSELRPSRSWSSTTTTSRISEYGYQAQLALSIIYRDAFAVLDALGWRPDPDATTTDVPLTAGHIEQLARCRYDLGRTNLDRLDDRDATTDPNVIAEIDAEIRVNRTAAQRLDQLISTYHQGGPT
jgi:hypothetical protein